MSGADCLNDSTNLNMTPLANVTNVIQNPPFKHFTSEDLNGTYLCVDTIYICAF